MKPANQQAGGRESSATAKVDVIISAALQVDLIADERAITEFMQAYFFAWSELNALQEKNALDFQNSFYDNRYLRKLRAQAQQDRMLRETQPAGILSIEIHGETAVVITFQTYYCDEDLRRFHLRRTDSGWKIERKGLRCFSCKGCGDQDGETCGICAGAGWCYGYASRDE